LTRREGNHTSGIALATLQISFLAIDILTYRFSMLHSKYCTSCLLFSSWQVCLLLTVKSLVDVDEILGTKPNRKDLMLKKY